MNTCTGCGVKLRKRRPGICLACWRKELPAEECDNRATLTRQRDALLAACRRVVIVANQIGESDLWDFSQSLLDMIDELRAAIAKVEGSP